MKKSLPFMAAFLFFIACQHSPQPKPDADRVIKDTLAQSIMRSFNERPKVKKIYATVTLKDEHFLCARDISVQHLLDEMKYPAQRFEINTEMPGDIKGKCGSRLTFNPRCFVGKDGKEFSGIVQISLNECFTLEEMLLQNLPNTNDAALRESMGAIGISASGGGKELKLKEGEKISLQLPFAQAEKQGYQIYYGGNYNNLLIDWNVLPEENSQADKLYATGNFTKPEFSIPYLRFKDYLNETINYPDEAKGNELSAKVEVSFSVSETGKITDVSTGETYKTFHDEIVRVLSLLPDCKPASYNGKNISSVVRFAVDFNIRRANQVKVEFAEDENELAGTSTNCYLICGRTFENCDPGKSVCTQIENLGWYSCMRQLPESKANADVIVADDAKADVKLVSKNNCIASPENCTGYSRFKSFRVGEAAFILAMKTENGKTFYAIQPLRLKQQNLVALVWKEGDRNEIARQVKKLKFT